ncbi:MAG: hypothetical protein JXB49_31325 [Bacteroidales bacterium]|nr:hypothetical protein [Bacteroidales bacterium]
MQNPIVNKYYTRFEKLGLKKHKVPQEEIDFLEKLSPDEQFIAFIEENRFKKKRIQIKRTITNIICFLVFMAMIILLLEYYFLWAGLAFIILAALLIISKRYQTRSEIYDYELAFHKMMQKSLLEKTFR